MLEQQTVSHTLLSSISLLGGGLIAPSPRSVPGAVSVA